MMTDILEIFKAYNGTGYYCILFIAALIYLWFTEEDRNIRILLVIVPTIIQVLFFIPYFYFIYTKLDEETYYRILWLLPMTLVIAYTSCKVIGSHTRLGVAIMVVILALSGTCVYTSNIVSFAANEYKLPEEVVTICDWVKPKEDEERIWVAFPPILVHYVRQYTTSIQLPFGRDSMVDAWKKIDNPLFELYMSPNMPADRINKYSNQYLCQYIVLEKEKEVIGDVTDYNFELIGSTENFLVYRNHNVPLSLKDLEVDYYTYIGLYDNESDDVSEE